MVETVGTQRVVRHVCHNLTMMPGERRITAPQLEEGGVAVHAERRTRSYAIRTQPNRHMGTNGVGECMML